MKKNVQKILFAIPIAVGLYLIVRQLTKGSKQTPPSADSSNNTYSDPVLSSRDSFPLKKGSYGPNVARLQRVLISLDSKALPKYGVDSDFGSETEAALVKQTGKKTISAIELSNLEDAVAYKDMNNQFGPRPYNPTYDPSKPFFLQNI